MAYNKNENHSSKYKGKDTKWAKIGPYGRAWVRVSIILPILIASFIAFIIMFD